MYLHLWATKCIQMKWHWLFTGRLVQLPTVQNLIQCVLCVQLEASLRKMKKKILFQNQCRATETCSFLWSDKWTTHSELLTRYEMKNTWTFDCNRTVCKYKKCNFHSMMFRPRLFFFQQNAAKCLEKKEIALLLNSKIYFDLWTFKISVNFQSRTNYM